MTRPTSRLSAGQAVHAACRAGHTLRCQAACSLPQTGARTRGARHGRARGRAGRPRPRPPDHFGVGRGVAAVVLSEPAARPRPPTTPPGPAGWFPYYTRPGALAGSPSPPSSTPRRPPAGHPQTDGADCRFPPNGWLAGPGHSVMPRHRLRRVFEPEPAIWGSRPDSSASHSTLTDASVDSVDHRNPCHAATARSRFSPRPRHRQPRIKQF